MINHQNQLSITTEGRGSIDITDKINDYVSQSKCQNGLCHIFVKHTSASIILCENYDPQVRKDLERFMDDIVPDGYAGFKHTAEGPDDMPAHIRTILTQSNLSVPIRDNQLDLGTWQGIYLWEHRLQGHRRQLTITITGV